MYHTISQHQLLYVVLFRRLVLVPLSLSGGATFLLCFQRTTVAEWKLPSALRPVQARYAPTHSSQSGILSVDATRTVGEVDIGLPRHAALEVKSGFGSFHSCACFLEPGLASKSKQIIFATHLLSCAFFRCAEDSGRRVAGHCHTLCTIVSSVSIPSAGILGKDCCSVHLNLSVLQQATSHPPPQLSSVLLYHANLPSQAKRVVCENHTCPLRAPVQVCWLWSIPRFRCTGVFHRGYW